MPDRVLVAYDESPQADAALDHALATFPDAELHVLHVTDPQEWVYPDAGGGGFYDAEAFERAEASAEELLATAADRAGAAGREVTTATAVGSAAATIVEYAEAHDVDHVVLGSHGRTGLARFLLGSVAETVARRASASVTIVRDADD